ncbi:MAG: hypothetical protein WED86_05290 [Chloroflexota bacterium]
MSWLNTLGRRCRAAVGLIAATSLLASLAPIALAATCGPAPVTIGAADVAFVGVMTIVDSAGTRATFAVEEVWKGDEVPAAVEVSGSGGQQWTDPSAAGARYLVLATLTGIGLQVGSQCNQLYLWDPSLAAARPATAHPPQNSAAGGDVPIPLLLIAGIALLVAAVSAFAFRSPPKAAE